MKSHDANVEYLTLVECDYLLQMLNTDKLTDSENKFLHYFLFSCFMGLRLEDVKALTYRNIKTEIDKENNKTYFLVTSLKKSKYKTTVKIPLHNRVLLLIDLNSLPDLKIFRGFCNQGKYLKPIIKKAGIDKDLHFHCSRHTFTNILSELGIPPEVAQVILGHSDIQTTMKHYYRVSDQRTIENMKKWDCV